MAEYDTRIRRCQHCGVAEAGAADYLCLTPDPGGPVGVAPGTHAFPAESGPTAPWVAVPEEDTRFAAVERRISPPERKGSASFVADVLCEVRPTRGRYGEPDRTAIENATRIASLLNGQRPETAAGTLADEAFDALKKSFDILCGLLEVSRREREQLRKLLIEQRAATIEECARHFENLSASPTCKVDNMEIVKELRTLDEKPVECICARDSHLAGLPVARVPQCPAHRSGSEKTVSEEVKP